MKNKKKTGKKRIQLICGKGNRAILKTVKI